MHTGGQRGALPSSFELRKLVETMHSALRAIAIKDEPTEHEYKLSHQASRRQSDHLLEIAAQSFGRFSPRILLHSH